MSKKNILIIFVVILVVLAAAIGLFLYSQKPQDLSKVSDDKIISLLNKNTDAKEYMQNHADFKIDEKEILTKEVITSRQNGAEFREVYQGLELQDNRYIRVKLINSAGDKGLVAVVDFKKQTAINAFGLLLLSGTN